MSPEAGTFDEYTKRVS